MPWLEQTYGYQSLLHIDLYWLQDRDKGLDIVKSVMSRNKFRQTGKTRKKMTRNKHFKLSARHHPINTFFSLSHMVRKFASVIL